MSVRQGRSGLLKPDTFADSRILIQPPGVGCLLILFSRNHNYIAKRLLQINENNRFGVTDTNDQDELKVQDENLFQTARLINCCCYLQVIIHDYLHAILGLDQNDSNWYLDPAKYFPKDTMTNPIPTGVGNQVSIEFNYIYRWHPTITQDDAIWIENTFKEMLGNDYPKQGEELSSSVFLQHKKEWSQKIPAEPEKRNFGGLKRITEGDLKGSFRDTDITRELVHGVSQVAGAFGPNGTPSILRSVEVLGINSARKLGICSLNEMRNFLNLQPYTTFEEMNPDKEVVDKLRMHYGHIDNVEFYPGILLEKTKPSMIGSGLAIDNTISRAILSDAVNLVRNDRFFTDDCNPHNLTSWGYAEVQSNTSVANGGFLNKIILRNTEGCYKPNSIFAMFPFHIPSKTKETLQRFGKLDQFDFSIPAIHEKQQKKIHRVLSYRGCHEVLSNKDLFNVTYDADLKRITGGIGYFLGFDDTIPHNINRARLEKAFYSNDHNKFISDFKQFFITITQKLIDKKKTTFDGHKYRIDVVRDICNLAPVYFVAEYFGVPLKTQEFPHGLYTEQETYLQLTVIFMFLFLNTDPTQSFGLGQTAVDVSKQMHEVLSKIIEYNSESFISKIVDSVIDSAIGFDFKPTDQSKRVMKSLMEQYKDPDLAAWNILCTIAGIPPQVGQAASQIVEFYLRPENESHLEEIRKLADNSDKESEDLVLGYVLEAMRFFPVIPGLLRRAAASSSVDDGAHGTAKFEKGDEIFLSLATAHMDPSVFTNPNEINPRRSRDTYMLFGSGFHGCFGKSVNLVAIPAIVKTILKLPNLRPTPGRAGKINRIEENGISIYVNSTGTLFPFPTDMVLEFTL